MYNLQVAHLYLCSDIKMLYPHLNLYLLWISSLDVSFVGPTNYRKGPERTGKGPEMDRKRTGKGPE